MAIRMRPRSKKLVKTKRVRKVRRFAELGLGKLHIYGGAGSGHFGHAGRSGKIGGSKPGSRNKPSGGSKLSEYEKSVNRAMKVTGHTEYGINSAIDRAYTGKTLSAGDKDILQAGWPKMHGKPGTTFKYTSEEQKAKKAFNKQFD